MKLLFAIFNILVVLAYVSANALPAVYDGPTYELSVIDEPRYEMARDLPPIRQRRVTCDLLSFTTPWVTLNHSACAGKCLTQGRKGGYCQNGACICRN